MTEDERHEAAEMLRYFWKAKSDPTRWVRWEEVKGEFPHIVAAWEAFLDAKRRMDLEVEDATT